MQTVTFSVELPHRWLWKSVAAKMPFLFLFCFLHSQMRSLSYYEVFHLILFVALKKKKNNMLFIVTHVLLFLGEEKKYEKLSS